MTILTPPLAKFSPAARTKAPAPPAGRRCAAKIGYPNRHHHTCMVWTRRRCPGPSGLCVDAPLVIILDKRCSEPGVPGASGRATYATRTHVIRNKRIGGGYRLLANIYTSLVERGRHVGHLTKSRSRTSTSLLRRAVGSASSTSSSQLSDCSAG